MKTILIPLDGSQRSDQVVWLIRSLTFRTGPDPCRVHLLRVIEPFERPRAERAEHAGRPDPHLTCRTEAAHDHLDELARRVGPEAVEVTTAVRMGAPVEVILETAAQIDATLIGMATRGRSGPLRWLKGSVTEQVLRRSPVPLLLLKPEDAGARRSLARGARFLIAHDGSPQAAAILPHAAELARLHDAELTLLRCLMPLAAAAAPSVPPLPPVAVGSPTGPGDQDQEILAREQLEGLRTSLEASGVPTRVRLAWGPAAGRILAVAEEEDAELIAMTTHGRRGVRRVLWGSVAESVLRGSDRPLLILNPNAAGALASTS